MDCWLNFINAFRTIWHGCSSDVGSLGRCVSPIVVRLIQRLVQEALRKKDLWRLWLCSLVRPVRWISSHRGVAWHAFVICNRRCIMTR